MCRVISVFVPVVSLLFPLFDMQTAFSLFPDGAILNTLTPNDLLAVLPRYIYNPVSSFTVDSLGFLQVFTMAKPLTLTFGIELEFVLRFDSADYPIHDIHDTLDERDMDDVLDELDETYPPLDQDDEEIAMVSKAQESPPVMISSINLLGRAFRCLVVRNLMHGR